MTQHLCSLFSSGNSNSKVTDAGFLLLRLFIGLSMAFAHGLGKLPPPEQLVQGVQGLGFPIPEFFAWSAGLAEFAGGVLIALGLLTRPAGAFLAFTMLVAVVGVHGADPYNIKELAFLYLTLGIFFVLVGAGRWSLDHVISKKCIK
ncbi:putative oxidoreductase CatD [compost metagenome]